MAPNPLRLPDARRAPPCPSRLSTQTRRLWLPGCLTTGFLGLDVAWISFLNEYAGSENEAANLHHWAVYALYVLFSAAALSMAWSLLRGEHRTAMRMRLLALIWILLGPIYYLWYPPAILGAVERVLALLMIGGHFALVAQALRHRAAAT